MKNDTIVNLVLTILRIYLIGVVGFTIYVVVDMYNVKQQGQMIAKEMGCEYIGENLPHYEVKILDCDGKIVHIRINK